MNAVGSREAALATGVSASTLRHYERLGLVPGVSRTTAGYRRYSARALERVLLIQRALVVGFSLAEVRKVLSVRDSGGAPCQGVRALVAGRLDTLTRQIAELRTLRVELRALLTDWDRRLAETPSGERAHLLESLASRPGVDRRRQSRLSRDAPRFAQSLKRVR
jgi:DNA-binding transcriptional MerR regulator